MALLLSRECLVMNASNSLIFIRFDVFAVVAVAQLVPQRGAKEPTDTSLIRGRGVGVRGNKNS